jgi:hypothetical protein
MFSARTRRLMVHWIHDHGRPIPLDLDILSAAECRDSQQARRFLEPLLRFAQFMEDFSNVIVARAELSHPTRGTARVATDFMGIDLGPCSAGPGWSEDRPPLLWETMTFFTNGSGTEGRYSTLAQAVEGHRQAVQRLVAEGFTMIEQEEWPLARVPAQEGLL